MKNYTVEQDDLAVELFKNSPLNNLQLNFWLWVESKSKKSDDIEIRNKRWAFNRNFYDHLLTLQENHYHKTLFVGPLLQFLHDTVPECHEAWFTDCDKIGSFYSSTLAVGIAYYGSN